MLKIGDRLLCKKNFNNFKIGNYYIIKGITNYHPEWNNVYIVDNYGGGDFFSSSSNSSFRKIYNIFNTSQEERKIKLQILNFKQKIDEKSESY